MTQKPRTKYDAVASYRARFNGVAMEFTEAREHDTKVDSWDSGRDLNTARDRVNSILDEYNHFRMGKEIDLVKVPDFPPDDDIIHTIPIDSHNQD